MRSFIRNWLRELRYRRGVRLGTTFNLDGEHIRIRELLAPRGCGEEQNVRAFAILCGAAAECAYRMQDELDLGGPLSEAERGEWLGAGSVLLHLADLHTPGREASRGELLGRMREWALAVRARMNGGR